MAEQQLASRACFRCCRMLFFQIKHNFMVLLTARERALCPHANERMQPGSCTPFRFIPQNY